MTTALLTGSAAPAITESIELAKGIRAQHDVDTIGTGLVRLFNDVGYHPARPGHWAAYDVLVGAGPPPMPAGSAGVDAWLAAAGRAGVGQLDDHLISNAAAYLPSRHGGSPGWRGAYLQKPIGADPWGHRYATNVAVMRRREADLLVVSAGQDGRLETNFEADGLRTPGDDIVMLVLSGGVGR
jgi:hypothetical protein